ncbi:MAG TPA: alpha/beta hydrolase [Lachnospiraceae bacterium]|nr:alpha/beta hydrolase [Lachnospiraceae bacterium]
MFPCGEKGKKEPFILLHGNGEDSTYFKHQIEYFSDRYRVIAIDTRGHGKSPRGTKPFTIEQFSHDLHDFMTGLEISDAIILGFSDGANIAMKFVLEYPDKVKALILNGGNLNPSGVKRTTQIPIEIGYRIAKRFASKSPDAKRNAEMLGLMVNEPNIEVNALSKITAPTLVICGSRDMIKKSHTKKIAENIPGAKLTIIDGNHFIANKRYAAFNKAVEDFLQTIAPKGDKKYGNHSGNRKAHFKKIPARRYRGFI